MQVMLFPKLGPAIENLLVVDFISIWALEENSHFYAVYYFLFPKY